MKRMMYPVLALSLAACGEKGLFNAPSRPDATPVVQSVDDGQTRPQARPAALPTPTAPPPPPSARTVEQFDTTSAEDRAAAAAAPEPAGEKRLGETVASLGDVTRPGFWLETPLVSVATQGRIEFPGSGKSAKVDLIPIDGPATAGSRVSLAAMRLIEAPLTDLPTIVVYSGG